MISKKLYIVSLMESPIFEQLALEEALLRADKRNLCLINRGSPPSVVMGISGKGEELLNESLVLQEGIPVIRRFSGGGTVFVDEQTLFITFIFNKDFFNFNSTPRAIMNWSGALYAPLFSTLSFALKENDYVLGEKKIGGNAQYIQKERWLHHTSFLWDFDPQNMAYLKHPKKTPDYRQGRSHADFLTPIAPHFSSQEAFLASFKEILASQFDVEELEVEAAKEVQSRPHRKATTRLNQYESEASGVLPL